MDLPFEVLAIIFSYLTPNDIMEASAVCKLFYHISRKIKLFVKKLHDSRKLYNRGNNKWIISYYSHVFVSFPNQLFVYLKENVNEENLFLAKNVIMDRLYYLVLPFRVWNHLFLCERSQYKTNMCRYCTKLCIKNKKISYNINNNSFVHMNEFLTQLKEGIWVTQKINLFVHSNIAAKNDLFGLKFDITLKNDLFELNFGLLYRESIHSPFLLWKANLDILC